MTAEFHAWSEKFSKVNHQTEGYCKCFLGKSTCLNTVPCLHETLANSASSTPDCRFTFTIETDSMQKNCTDFLKSIGIQC